MIRSIPKITSFGVFNDFKWHPGLPQFKQYNLIYGWNYSGKTTLSRVFRCFEQGQEHADFTGVQVQLMADDGTIHDQFANHNAPVFRVFNSDFVQENISFADGSAMPVLVLGAEDIAKQELLKVTKSEWDALALSKGDNEIKRNETNSDIQRALTKYARDFIKNPLAVPAYDKTRFELRVNECKAIPKQHLLNNTALAECLTVYRSTEKKPALSAKLVQLSSVTELKEKTALLLARVVLVGNPIARLKENSEIESWVNKGRPLHKGKDACQFCGQQLPNDLLDRFVGHFSADYDNLMEQISALAEAVQVAEKEDIKLDHRGDFYPELAKRFAAEKSKLDTVLKARNAALASLATALDSKKTKAFTSMNCPPIDDYNEQVVIVVEAINNIIDEHNTRTAEFDKKREDAFGKLEKHYAALFVSDEKYNEKLKAITDLDNTIAGQVNRINELLAQIRTLEQAISESAKGAERINELLAAYFGKDDLRVVVSAEKRFQIVRGSVVAKNLSDGEKTAIAFAYFIARVQDGRHPLADTRIVIDDPISSLDANHLFNTYAMIKTQLADCRQLFISTHSFEFYNLIREWVADDEGKQYTKKPQAAWRKWSVFLVKRIDKRKSIMEEIPKELLKFKSEYHYLFSKLYIYDKTGNGDFDCLLSLPNIARRFMEAFGGVMIPLSTGLKGKMELIFPDPIVRERVWKFINVYSHQTTLNRSLIIPDMSECKAIVKACLNAVQDWNAEYFKCLEKEVS